jgi:ankyrin repeat protein
MGSIKGILKKWEGEYDIKDDLFAQLKPMTDEEIRRREKAKIAEREIVKKGLSIEQIKSYVKEDGTNINKDNCVALLHAVEENNLEKAKVILELGGSPNLRSKADSIINKAQDLDMIKLLVSNGSELTGEVFNNICNDLDAVEYCLKQGLDPNFDNSLPIRRCCKGGWKTKDDIGEGYYDVFQLLVKYGAKLADEGGRNMAIKWAAEYGRLNFIDYMLEKGVKTGFKAALSWLKHSRKIPDDKKAITISYLENKIKEYGDV